MQGRAIGVTWDEPRLSRAVWHVTLEARSIARQELTGTVEYGQHNISTVPDHPIVQAI